MMVQDKSLNYIDADPQDIIALYKSSSPVTLQGEGFGREPWNAYICCLQEQNVYCIFMGLSNASSKRTIVYSMEEQPENKEEYARLLPTAFSFAESMGFSMVNVNLDYSKALREVIISDTRVIRPGKAGKRNASRKTDPIKEKSSGKTIAENGTAPADLTAPGTSSGSSEIITGTEGVNGAALGGFMGKEAPPRQEAKTFGDNTFARVVTVAKSDAHRSAEVIPLAGKKSGDELAALRKEAERLSSENAASRKAFERKLADADSEVARLRAEKSEFDVKAAGELEKLKKEAERLSADKEAAEKALAREMAEIKTVIESMSGDSKEGSGKRGEELAKLKLEAERLSGEKSSAEMAALRELSAAKTEVSRLGDEVAAIREKVATGLAELKKEAERLSSEKTAAENAAAQELAAVKTEIRSLTEELTWIGEKTDEELADLRTDAGRLFEAKTAAQGDAARELAEAEAERANLKNEIEEIRITSGKEISSLREEIERLARARAAAKEEADKQVEEAGLHIQRLTAEMAEAETAAAEKLALLKSEAARLAGEKIAAQRNAAGEIEAAQKVLQAIVSDKNAVEASLAEQLDAIRKERERITAEKEAHEIDSGRKVDEAKEELSRLTAEKAAVEAKTGENLAALRAELDTLAAKKAAAEKEAEEKTMSMRKELESLSAVKTSVETSLAEQVLLLDQERQRLEEEKAAAEKSFADRLAGAKADLEKVVGEMSSSIVSMAEKLAEVRSYADSLLQSMDASFKGSVRPETGAEAMSEISAPVRAAAPTKETEPEEKAGRERKAEAVNRSADDSATGGIERVGGNSLKVVSPEFVDSKPVSAETTDECFRKVRERTGSIASTRLGTESLSVEKALAGLIGTVSSDCFEGEGIGCAGETSRSGNFADGEMGTAVSVSPAQEGPVEADEDESSSPEEEGDLSTEFHIDRSVRAVEYASHEEVLEVFQSLNIARITPEGYLAQNAKGFACAVKKGGLISVYIGLLLTDKGEVLIYTPKKRSRRGGYRKLIQNAIDFLETAGFLMDPLSLGNDLKNRVKVISGVPIFSHVHQA